MNRLEELTFKLLDEALSYGEQCELDWLLKDDASLRAHCRLMELEGHLRAQLDLPALAANVMGRINTVNGSGLRRRVMDRIEAAPKPAWQTLQPRVIAQAASPVHRRRYNTVFGWSSFAAGLILGVLIVLAMAPAKPSPVAIGRIDAALNTQIERGSERLPVAKDLVLYSGDRLVAAPNGGAILELNDASRLFLTQDSSATLLQSDEGMRVELATGTLRATVNPQPAGAPFTVATRHAVATVLGTRFSVLTTEADTQLEVKEGRVQFESLIEQASVVVATNQFAVVAAGRALQVQALNTPPAITSIEPHTPKDKFAVLSFTLVDANLGTPVPGYTQITQDTVLDLKKLPRNISLTANTAPEIVGCVVFDIDDKVAARIENTIPYAVTTNWDDNHYLPWDLKPGKITVKATPRTENNGNGQAGETLTVTFTVLGR